MKKKILLITVAVILLCSATIAGVTYALFTDSSSVDNHLKAGNLDVTLKRVSLEYTVFDEDGYLDVVTLDGEENELLLTKSTAENVFGIDSDTNRIVPGSYFDAKLAIGNNGDVAFDYSVEIKLITEDEEEANALSSQLKLTVTDASGNAKSYMLSELYGTADCKVLAGHMKKTDTEHFFNVKVSFENDANNNAAKAQTAVFDLVVSATQASTQS